MNHFDLTKIFQKGKSKIQESETTLFVSLGEKDIKKRKVLIAKNPKEAQKFYNNAIKKGWYADIHEVVTQTSHEFKKLT